MMWETRTRATIFFTRRTAAHFRLQAPEPLELEACANALERLLAPPAMWCCYPAGAVELTAAQHARYARMGLKRGMPDILIFHAGLWGIEIKRRGGRLSKTRVVRTRRGSLRCSSARKRPSLR
jgi:hypothetical protein